MRQVVLLYDRDCPNVVAARTNLVRAFVAAKVAARWSEVDRAAPDTPEAWRGYGSPTVLVDGRDVAGAGLGAGPTCRVYSTAEGLLGAPPVELIAARLDAWQTEPPPSSWRSLVAVAPGIGFALLPKLGCPACWPAYAGLLSALGLGFLGETRYLLPLTITFLALTLGALGWGAARRRGWAPFALGVVAAGLILGGKFVLEVDALLYAGVALLVGASLWNSWPRVRAAQPMCPACAPDGGGVMAKRKIEVFSAGCAVCEDALAVIHAAACPSCGVEVHDMRDPAVAARAKALGIRSVPAVLIDGRLADCCSGRGIDLDILRAHGLGVA